MVLPDQPHKPGDVPPEWFQWRGGVDNKLENIDKKVDKNSDTLEKMPDEIEKRMEKVMNGTSKGQPVTWKAFAEKFLLPIVILVASLIIAASFASAP